MSASRFVVFDLDGVLVDSEPYWRAGFRAGVARMARELGAEVPELSEETLVAYEGGRVPDTLRRLGEHLFGHEGRPYARALPGAVDTCIETAVSLFQESPTPIATSVETARALYAEGYGLAVASSSALRFVRAALETIGLADLVSAAESAFELPRSKPHPQVYLNTLQALGSTPANTVAIEDSTVGVEAALRAGLRTVWLTQARASAPNVGRPVPDLRIVSHLDVQVVRDLFDGRWSR